MAVHATCPTMGTTVATDKVAPTRFLLRMVKKKDVLADAQYPVPNMAVAMYAEGDVYLIKFSTQGRVTQSKQQINAAPTLRSSGGTGAWLLLPSLLAAAADEDAAWVANLSRVERTRWGPLVKICKNEPIATVPQCTVMPVMQSFQSRRVGPFLREKNHRPTEIDIPSAKVSESHWQPQNAAKSTRSAEAMVPGFCV